MGMFDQFVGLCPTCQSPFSSQTKIDQDVMEDIEVGDRLMSPLTIRLRLKTGCPSCKSPIVAVISEGLVEKFESTGEDFAEGVGGALLPKGDSWQKQCDRIEKDLTNRFGEKKTKSV